MAGGKENMDDKQSLLTQTQLRFIKSLSGRNLSTHTATAYQTDIRQFLSFLTENDMTVDSPTQITRTHILDYLTHLAELGRSGVTRVRKLAAIRAYCKFLTDEQSISHSPAENIIRPKQERKQQVFLRVDEYMRLLNAAVGNYRDYAILQLFLQSGIRVSELVGLTMDELDLDAGTMLINGKGNKQCDSKAS
jgi:site-specific recombinase XerD